MTPFRFGPAARQLHGVYHAPATTRTAAQAVLICAPYGQEGVRFHRLQRVLAERLSGRGVAVLRFDYAGSGDSAGNDEEADLVSWRADILLAHQELRRRSRAPRVAWLGARLGGTAAISACHDADPPPDTLVLWDPLLDGKAYLDELAIAHARVLAEMRHRSAPSTARPIDSEVLGFGIGRHMLAQLAALRPEQALRPASASITLVSGSADPSFAALATRWSVPGKDTQSHALAQRFDWTSEEAMNTALVPAPVLELLAARLGVDADA